jgi:hypothetical protein
VPDTNCDCASNFGHDYRFCNVLASTYSVALQDCESHGMTTIRVDSQAENDWLFAEFNARGMLTTTFVYLGGTDSAVEGQWSWSDGTLFYDSGPVGGLYSDWGTLPKGQQSDCLVMRPTSLWNDAGCNAGGVVYACESLWF